MKLALITVTLVALMTFDQAMALSTTERNVQTTTEEIENCVGPACPVKDEECKCDGICEHVVSVDPCICGRNWSCPELTKRVPDSDEEE